MTQETIGPVLGRIPSGVFILTAKIESGSETGMLASWVQQASFDPPAVTVAVNKKRYLNSALTEGTSVVLNLLGESNKKMLGHFGSGFEPDEPAFEGLNTEESPAGLTILKDGLGWLEGQITSTVDAGDHVVYVVQLSTAGANDSLESDKPFVHIRKNGFNY